MFVIRRKIGQSIRIGDGIIVEVLDATPNRVKLGVHAPSDVRVSRSEVLIAEEQNRQAARAPGIETISRLAEQLRNIHFPAPSHPPSHGAPPTPDKTGGGPA
jgi:carbon storage regulator